MLFNKARFFKLSFKLMIAMSVMFSLKRNLVSFCFRKKSLQRQYKINALQTAQIFEDFTEFF